MNGRKCRRRCFTSNCPPAFRLNDLWHVYGSFILPTEDWGTAGFLFNFVNMGTNTITNDFGVETGTTRSVRDGHRALLRPQPYPDVLDGLEHQIRLQRTGSRRYEGEGSARRSPWTSGS